MKKPSSLCLTMLCAGVFSLISCGTGPLVQGPPVPHLVPFNEADLAFAQHPGTATVSGQICVKFTDGSIARGKHISVALMPKTPYTTEIVNRKFINRENLTPTGPRLEKYMRRTVSDENGYFVFHNVPAGEYIVNGVVEWKDSEEYTDPDTGSTETAISWWTNHKWAWKHIKIGEGQSLRVMVTQ
jgi:hypothetical protein